ncbi:MAG: tRNA (adenosine(37)-N6)-threonylcarbamoyltransferase complex transferase subunit TsaD [Deltaproteobacteria bacterium RIFCSPLOWO2_02_FULL_50_16]|nr:MAG: tRNA (adenosine(37)-N6)-threonylcarbamoyltransferase complex transferase subunit TsaD [Deltaproteobacteria bacterium GWA2_50_8]OGQ28550.1 MAG: tRNA (adenosine(37)-N6)-threonylcarbamoyltransferase complex transferase subunit TsaD [Deltaproteobacteria bacterium RIFCSPHIGHO2_02_FULL_50_15]OGQ57152.1 MAG: tRNA (adenosine(37)-N6)-threonylcarbamoyltransferase complex transferase subunit TsaD [Deltaproteobacteria bacterium RIFCSPLOWO2_02_FULL_50_16]
MSLTLGIESSCDETAVALLEGPRKVLINLIQSQEKIHSPYGGIVPEIASRCHIEVILPLIDKALKETRTGFKDLTGIAVTTTPGLIGSLLVGLSVAKAISYAHDIPFIGVNHLEGHLNAPFLEYPDIPYPHLGLMVSGGHTALFYITGFGHYQFLGATRDDAAGEAFDKIAKLVHLGYPGGPVVDQRARKGDPHKIKFPQGKVRGSPMDFSFSGLKTAVLQHVQKNQALYEDSQGPVIDDLCASVQEAIVQALLARCESARATKKCQTLVVTGGVACNQYLRKVFNQWGQENEMAVYYPSLLLCTDNAAMIASVGARHLAEGKRSSMTLNAVAHRPLTEPLPVE